MRYNFQCVSDLHLEFNDQDEIIKRLIPKSDNLFLLGDICHLANIEKHIKFFDYLNDNWKNVIYLEGNHERYSGYKKEYLDLFENKNIKFIDKYNVYYYKVDKENIFVFCTLSTYTINPVQEIIWKKEINDFNENKKDFEKLMKSYENVIIFFEDILYELKCKYNYKNIYLFSHFPSKYLISKKYNYNLMFSDYFYNFNLEEILFKYNIKYNFYGHIHDNNNTVFFEKYFIERSLGYNLNNNIDLSEVFYL